ncbi:uncharacterized protein LOC120533129 isoform X1 [Polypterus senegalus]|uniref:uncharacterized protein LOC120533129 isoform X1 n=1 Tax=Polypterus senegalus TaxID=55291 RepID=UPI001962BD7D|nr:uncharacterized protein LOC120533129 isoform X1 [Polypterus senegalus]
MEARKLFYIYMLVYISLLTLCNSESSENITSELSMESTWTTAATMVNRQSKTEATLNTEEQFSVTSPESDALQRGGTSPTTDADVPVIFHLQEESNKMNEEISEESNSFNEIITAEESPLDGYQETSEPPPVNFVNRMAAAGLDASNSTSDLKTVTASQSPLNTTEKFAYGMDTWKAGLISIAVLLAVGTFAMTAYCLKSKRKKSKRLIAVKVCEDSEAGETMHEESSENTVTGRDLADNRATDGESPVQHQSNGSEVSEQTAERHLVRDGDVNNLSNGLKSSGV